MGLMAGSAFAGTAAVNNVVAIGIETLGTNRPVVLSGQGTAVNPGNLAMSYTLGTTLQSGDLLQVNLTGMTFNTGVVSVCATNGSTGQNVALFSETLAANNLSSLTAQLTITGSQVINGTAGGAVGNQLWLTTNATTSNCNINTPLDLVVQAGESGSLTAAMFITTSGGSNIVDTASTANAVNVIQQYSYGTVGSVNNTIDYTTTATANGSNFTTGNQANDPNATNIVTNTVTVGVADTGLTVTALLSLQDSQNWQGVTNAYIVPGTSVCNIANNIAAATTAAALNGTVNFTIPATNISQLDAAAAVNNTTLCVTVSGGNVALTQRTITATPTIIVTGTGAATKATGNSATLETWNVNAYQGYVPWLVNSSVLPTYCLINNQSTTVTANIILDVLGGEGSAVLSGKSLGSLAPKTSVLATFTANSVSLTGGTAVDLTALGANNRYSGKLTVTTNPTNVTVTCNQIDPATGGKRSVPVLQNNNTNGFFE